MKKTISASLYVTSNWNGKNCISTQILFEDKQYLYYNINFPHFKSVTISNVIFIPWEFKENGHVIADFLKKNAKKLSGIKEIEVCFYEQILDIYGLFSRDYLKDFFTTPASNHKKKNYIFELSSSIYGKLQYSKGKKFSLRDLSGWSKKKELKELFEIVGYSTRFDNIFTKEEKKDLEKSLMNRENTENYCNMVIEELKGLEFVDKNMLELVNEVLVNLNFPKQFCFKKETLPKTIGSLMANILQKFIYFQMCRNENNELDIEKFKLFDKINKNMGTDKAPKLTDKNLSKRISLNKQTEKKSNLLNGARPDIIAKGYLMNSGLLNLLIHGGRVNNEIFDQYLFKCVLDIDFVSCYATAIQECYFPIGIPYIFASTDKQPKISLKKFLEKYEKDLVDKLYTITISGKLNFSQDLLYSKYITKTQLKEMQEKYFLEETKEVETDFLLPRKELCNCIITSDLLDALRKIPANTELKELMECKVETACFYRNSDYLEPVEFLKHFENEKSYGSYIFDEKYQANQDSRTRKWTKIHLNELIEPLMKKREESKKKRDEAKALGNLIDFAKFDSQQKFYKLCCNSMYGALSSSLFVVGNSVVSNVITAQARLNLWLMSKAIKGIQTIVDGASYSALSLFEIVNASKPLPGLNVLANLNLEGSKHRNIKVTTLGNKSQEDWETIFLEKNKAQLNVENLNKLATNHITNFWEPYGIKLAFKIDHKIENCATKSMHFMKSHYGLNPVFGEKGEINIKARTISEEEEALIKKIMEINTQDKNPLVQKEEFEKWVSYPVERKQKIAGFLADQKTNLSPKIYPGDVKIMKKHFHFGMNGMPFDDVREFKKREKEDVDVAKISIERVLTSKEEIVNVKDVFEEMFQVRNRIFLEQTKQNRQKNMSI